MNFWDLDQDSSMIACIDHESGIVVSYAQLQKRVELLKAQMSRYVGKSLGIILCENSLDTLCCYLAALQAKHAAFLFPKSLAHNVLQTIVQEYSPEWVFSSADLAFNNYTAEGSHFYHIDVQNSHHSEIFPDLAILLPTSGTTGKGRYVRLSYKNLKSNARSIASYLKLTALERPILSLPMHYSYGLSVINSHLASGSTLLMTNKSVVEPSFWEFASNQNASSFAGVPYSYYLLEKVGIASLAPASMSTFTLAGGALATPLKQKFLDMCDARNWNFFVMYGQTEATARISYVPLEYLRDKIESIGIPIPGGKLSLDPTNQELIYSGDNVMLGYASSRKDLSKGDEQEGVLRTGDSGYMDKDGFFYLTGRLKRLVKLMGVRFQLDEIENHLTSSCQKQVVCVGDDHKLYFLVESEKDRSEIQTEIAKTLNIHPTLYELCVCSSIPRNQSQKIDYSKALEMVAGGRNA